MKKSLGKMVLHIGLTIVCIAIILPFILMLGTSLSAETTILEQGYCLVASKITLDAYGYLLKNFQKIINAYGVTFLFAIVSAVLSSLLCCMLAYPLSRSTFKGKKFVSLVTYFAALLGGGLVGTYLVNAKYLNLNDTIWIYILPGLISPLYVFLLRCFFREIPEELVDSIIMDGGGEYTIFGNVFMPAIKPVAALLGVLTFVQKWNDWFTAQMYINDEKLASLQFYLYSTIRNSEFIRRMQEGGSEVMLSVKELPIESIRMAMCTIVVVSTIVIFSLVSRLVLRRKWMG